MVFDRSVKNGKRLLSVSVECVVVGLIVSMFLACIT